MAQISSFLRDAGALFTNLFLQPDWRNVFDVAIMTVIIYYIIKLLIHTRASAVFKGIAVVLVFAWVSDALQLNALNWLLQQVISMGLLVLVIMFQPELRRGLEQLGRSNWSRHMFTSARKQRLRDVDKLVQEGYLTRQPVAGDRRKTALACTPRAQEVIRRGRQLQTAFFDSLFRGMEPPLRTAFIDAMQIIDSNLDQLLREER